jgi:hypothetical protein
MATPSTIRGQLVWKLSGVDWAMNVLHWTSGFSGSLLADDVSAMAAEISGLFTSTTLKNHYSPSVLLDRLEVRDIRTDGNEILSAPINLQGTGTANTLPAQTCLVTTIRTTLASRRGRGRIYWPAMSVVAVGVNGQATTGAVTAAGAFTEGLFSVAAGTFGPVILSVLSRTDNVARSVVTQSTNSVFDVQTRRRDLSIT